MINSNIHYLAIRMKTLNQRVWVSNCKVLTTFTETETLCLLWLFDLSQIFCIYDLIGGLLSGWFRLQSNVDKGGENTSNHTSVERTSLLQVFRCNSFMVLISEAALISIFIYQWLKWSYVIWVSPVVMNPSPVM